MVNLTVPMIFGIVAMMLLGIVDTWFISLLGTPQLAAIGFAIPIYMIFVSLALGIGMGISSITSRLIGEHRHDDAASYISCSLLLAFLFSIAIAIIVYFQIDLIFTTMGAEPRVLQYIQDYMHVLLIGIPFLMITITCGNTFRAIGAMKTSAILSSALALLNLALDPVFIFGFGFIPAYGMKGAAYATLIAATVTAAISLFILVQREKLLILTVPRLHELRHNWTELLHIAIPAMGANIMTPVAAAVMTSMIAGFGAEAVAGFGVGSRIESISLLIVFALSASLPMFIGQNIGAGRADRAYEALMMCLKFSVIFQILVYGLLLLLLPVIGPLFSDDGRVIDVINRYIMILPVTYAAHGVVILVMVSLNVLRRPRLALLTTIYRLLVFYLPLAWLGSHIWGVNGLFAGAALGNILAGIVSFYLIKKVCAEENLSPAQVAVNNQVKPAD